MKIYFAHATSGDYKNDFYAPLRKDGTLRQHELILPHEDWKHENNSREFYDELDVMIAEVSNPSTGMGIELGWAYDAGVPIYAFCREGAKISGAVYAVTENVIKYTDSDDFVKKVNEAIIK